MGLRDDIRLKLVESLPYMEKDCQLHRDILEHGFEVAMRRAVDHCEKEIIGIRALTGDYRR